MELNETNACSGVNAPYEIIPHPFTIAAFLWDSAADIASGENSSTTGISWKKVLVSQSIGTIFFISLQEGSFFMISQIMLQYGSEGFANRRLPIFIKSKTRLNTRASLPSSVTALRG